MFCTGSSSGERKRDRHLIDKFEAQQYEKGGGLAITAKIANPSQRK